MRWDQSGDELRQKSTFGEAERVVDEWDQGGFHIDLGAATKKTQMQTENKRSEAAYVMMEWMFRAICIPFVHSADARFEEEHAAPTRCVSDMAGNVECVMSKCVFVNSIAEFCWEP